MVALASGRRKDACGPSDGINCTRLAISRWHLVTKPFDHLKLLGRSVTIQTSG
ncbi:hypothetical protein BXY66_2593 [Shimia isoporae]|uniref:Uncharacterized protein n=1 Tax=Shimia isoporae TaxID=647720 RepID=A0A4V2Q262_9RHOB|nr:hypothetical protein BXY66_2593 [Shimia isoporae]